jgi:hypothetical protein
MSQHICIHNGERRVPGVACRHLNVSWEVARRCRAQGRRVCARLGKLRAFDFTSRLDSSGKKANAVPVIRSRRRKDWFVASLLSTPPTLDWGLLDAGQPQFVRRQPPSFCCSFPSTLDAIRTSAICAWIQRWAPKLIQDLRHQGLIFEIL